LNNHLSWLPVKRIIIIAIIIYFRGREPRLVKRILNWVLSQKEPGITQAYMVKIIMVYKIVKRRFKKATSKLIKTSKLKL
jgi:hypothetical protein